MSTQAPLTPRLTCLLVVWCIPGLEMVGGQINPPSELPLEAQDCIEHVIAVDDSLGAVRNHACEVLSLAQTIRNYTNAMAALSFENCPKDFTDTFEGHRKAWLEMIPFVENYPDLRGEMHILFDEFEKGPEAEKFEPLIKKIWDTWYEVENAVKEE